MNDKIARKIHVHPFVFKSKASVGISLLMLFLLVACVPPVQIYSVTLDPEPRLGEPFTLRVTGENPVFLYVILSDGIVLLPDQPYVQERTHPAYQFAMPEGVQMQIDQPGDYVIGVVAHGPRTSDGQASDERRVRVTITEQATQIEIEDEYTYNVNLLAVSKTPTPTPAPTHAPTPLPPPVDLLAAGTVQSLGWLDCAADGWLGNVLQVVNEGNAPILHVVGLLHNGPDGAVMSNVEWNDDVSLPLFDEYPTCQATEGRLSAIAPGQEAYTIIPYPLKPNGKVDYWPVRALLFFAPDTRYLPVSLIVELAQSAPDNYLLEKE
ncbi:MAG: hypothetical protein JXA33_18780 [Anaerolineae bacterium]|nr:hypothetical protein [Anaerolineae bacterium]